MSPVEFEGHTGILAKDQPEYQPLPVQGGLVGGAHYVTTGLLSCWELTDEDIKTLIETRKLWLMQMTHGKPFQPILPSVDRPKFVVTMKAGSPHE